VTSFPARRRALLAGVPHLLAAAPPIVVLTAAGDRLPEPIASHFGLTGVADGFAGRGTVVAVAAGLGIGLALLFGLCARGAGSAAVSRWDTGRWFVGLSWATAGILEVVETAGAVANLGGAEASAAVLPGWTLPLALLVGAAAGVLGGLLAPRTPAAGSDPEPVRAVTIEPSERVSWSRTAGSPWSLLAGGALVVGAIAVGVALNAIAGVALALGGALVLVLSSATVTVDRRGLTVAIGLLGWPRVRVPADDVASAAVADVSAWQFGGWGYRVVPGGRGVIMRSGPALVVTRRSGQRFTVTVDDPGTAAGLLNGIATEVGRPC
jgi:hypothetical protein